MRRLKVSSYVIKSALDKEQTILGTNGINYGLFRRSLVFASGHKRRFSKKTEGANSGIINSYFNMLVSSVG